MFHEYAERGGLKITRALFEKNLAGKLDLPQFTSDLPMLLPPGVTFNMYEAASKVLDKLIALLPGDPWKGLAGRGTSHAR